MNYICLFVLLTLFLFTVFVAIVFVAIDVILYRNVVNKHGPQWKLWPGSGFYVAWKYRNH